MSETNEAIPMVHGDVKTRRVTVAGEEVPWEPSLVLRNHSPNGFAWGYGGSGPAQLALALLLHVTGDEGAALNHYQAFKWEVLAKTDVHADLSFPLSVVTNWLEVRRTALRRAVDAQS